MANRGAQLRNTSEGDSGLRHSAPSGQRGEAYRSEIGEDYDDDDDVDGVLFVAGSGMQQSLRGVSGGSEGVRQLEDVGKPALSEL